MKELMNWLNDSGAGTTNRNQKFTYNRFRR